SESGTHLIFITLDFVTRSKSDLQEEIVDTRQIGIHRSIPSAKCVVFDLDNTLWEGVLIEGDISLKSGVEELFRTLDERGILLSVASKNNEKEALEKLEKSGLAQYLVHPLINWSPKSENIGRLAAKLNISTDTIIFIDDSPFEREEVSSNYTEIEVLAESALDDLVVHPRLSGGSTNESRNRRLMYQQQFKRDEAVQEFGANYIDFLRQCEIKLEITGPNKSNQSRVVELVQRTNQLNFSGRKYSRSEVNKILDDKSLNKHVIRCSDKYGDYGIVGFAISHTHDKLTTIQDFMLSCRVQGKLIEKAFFEFLVKSTLQYDGILRINFVQSNRNAPARAVLNELGFTLSDTDPAEITVTPDKFKTDFINVIAR
ncbi:MAG: HAD-IIIC family phosphatase, partial [Granulosicoccus sp.]|nr:HAD-IIIC family phosphatase [Granulosicoccus sp.]